VAGSAGEVRQLEDGVQPILELGARRSVGANLQGAADAGGSHRQLGRRDNCTGPSGRFRRKRGLECNQLGRSRGGFATKIHALVDGKGRPLHLELTPGQRHEATVAELLIDHAIGKALIGDAGYDSAAIRAKAKAQGMVVVIPSHPTRAVIRRYDKKLYGIRYRIEVFFHRLKRCRRIATRYEKTARNYLGLLHLACALLWIS
jgi:transposase